MLYDNGRIGWVVGKHEWRTGPPIDDDDWDIEWSDGKKEYYGAGSLTIFIINYLNLLKANV